MRPSLFSLAAACLFALMPGGSRDVHARGPAAISSETSVPGMVTITAIVTDRKGQSVPGLKAADFEVLVDGKPQTLDSAEPITTATPLPRAFAFLLDEFHTAASDSAAVRAGLLRFVDTRLRPGDVAMVVKPLDALTDIKTTPDREAIRQAIESFEGRKDDLAPRTAFERNYMAQAPEAVQYARAQIVTSALRAIGMSLSQKHDVRPAIVLVSDGFARIRTGRDLPANLQTAVRIANRADAPVYAFAPSLVVPTAGAESEPDPALTALRSLATDTGGEVFTGAAELDTGLTRMSRDLDARYVLTYRAAHGNDGRFHALQVAVKRQNALVRAKTGYVAPIPDAIPAASTPAVPLRVFRRSPLILSWSATAPLEAGKMKLTLTWEPAAPTSVPRPRASTALVAATSSTGTVLFDGAIGPAGEPPSKDVPNVATFETPAGVVRIDMKILDAKGVVLDTDSRDVTVQTPRAGIPVMYSAAVFCARSAREFRQMLTDLSAPPTPSRDFRRTDRLLIRAPALGTSGAPATVAGALLNRWRQPMRDIDPMEPAADGVTQFDLPLAGLAPGEYTLRLTIPGPSGLLAEHVTFRVRG